jgi:hypothetical protein
LGAIWLLNLPKWIRDAGLDCETFPGWETRSRSTGGYDRVMAIGPHHDAVTAGTPLLNRINYQWRTATDRPIGAMHLGSDGRVVVGAAGATNTQGKGGPVRTSQGLIPLNQGNLYMLSIEASNNGVGEVWPEVQQEAYRVLCKKLCDELGLEPLQDIIAHFEWTTRKIDPAGNSRYATGGNKWDMNLFRSDVTHELAPLPPPVVIPPTPTPTPTPEPTPIPQPVIGEDMSVKTIILDARNNGVYIANENTKTWIDRGDDARQIKFRIMEAMGLPVDYSKEPNEFPASNITLTPGVAIDGHRYSLVRNGDPSFISSFGPFTGTRRPSGLDEYGR